MIRVRVLARQLAFRDSPAGLATAQTIVGAKVRNCESLLGRFISSRRRAKQGIETLTTLQNKLTVDRSRINDTNNTKNLFLLEARAARNWWRAVAIIGHQPDWQRMYPRAADPLNILLNTGYTILGRHCAKALTAAGLEPVIGVYHGENSGTPLVWDLEESFRQIAVDAVILPAFSRRSKTKIDFESRAYNKILGRLGRRYHQPLWYRGQCEQLERIIGFEAVKLRRAILVGTVYKPYQHRWGHRQRCQR